MSAITAEELRTHFDSALGGRLGGSAAAVTDDAELTQLGLDSLALVRIVIELIGDEDDREIDLGEVAEMRTIGELRRWITGEAIR